MPNTNTAAQKVAARMQTWELAHVATALNAEIEAAMIAGVRGTQSHIGAIELATACADELVSRGGYVPPMPVDVSYIDGCKLSNAIRVY